MSTEGPFACLCDATVTLLLLLFVIPMWVGTETIRGTDALRLFRRRIPGLKPVTVDELGFESVKEEADKHTETFDESGEVVVNIGGGREPNAPSRFLVAVKTLAPSSTPSTVDGQQHHQKKQPQQHHDHPKHQRQKHQWQKHQRQKERSHMQKAKVQKQRLQEQRQLQRQRQLLREQQPKSHQQRPRRLQHQPQHHQPQHHQPQHHQPQHHQPQQQQPQHHQPQHHQPQQHQPQQRRRHHRMIRQSDDAMDETEEEAIVMADDVSDVVRRQREQERRSRQRNQQQQHHQPQQHQPQQRRHHRMIRQSDDAMDETEEEAIVMADDASDVVRRQREQERRSRQRDQQQQQQVKTSSDTAFDRYFRKQSMDDYFGNAHKEDDEFALREKRKPGYSWAPNGIETDVTVIEDLGGGGRTAYERGLVQRDIGSPSEEFIDPEKDGSLTLNKLASVLNSNESIERLQLFSDNPSSSVHWEEPAMMSNCWLHKLLANRYSFTPSCKPDGTYYNKQCYLERCWCVDDEGRPRDRKFLTRFSYKKYGSLLYCSPQLHAVVSGNLLRPPEPEFQVIAHTAKPNDAASSPATAAKQPTEAASSPATAAKQPGPVAPPRPKRT